MTFLAMIIALSLHQVIQPDSFLQRDTWLLQWNRWATGRIVSPAVRVAITLIAVTLVVVWALATIDDWLFGLLELLATAGLFVWSLGRADFHTALERFEARAATDPLAATAALEALWAPIHEPESHEPGPMERLVYSGYARWFAPLFYFALGGVLAAVLYRVVSVLAEREQPPSAYTQLLRWADWAPSRVLGLTFALTGDFMAVSKRAPLKHFADATPASQLLQELAGVACNHGESARELGNILYRSAGLWLVFLSVVLIFG
ncbi:regulatory signaling modulator protein AmpE [Congregibacter litoralis]|uniref:Membrane protein required for beta-lactamase induction n=1 Tax=Congregibacter litoralis KT71 TaxID=314285 RepID=A4A5I5_9GAMM|nr:regulatory signaling modulator protein AmpE [Congregibacter litoralis]EAQ99056.1 Membrane protein required for beta-lactamase induction [Congregibacter litoralis KT71]